MRTSYVTGLLSLREQPGILKRKVSTYISKKGHSSKKNRIRNRWGCINRYDFTTAITLQLLPNNQQIFWQVKAFVICLFWYGVMWKKELEISEINWKSCSNKQLLLTLMFNFIYELLPVSVLSLIDGACCCLFCCVMQSGSCRFKTRGSRWVQIMIVHM